MANIHQCFLTVYPVLVFLGPAFSWTLLPQGPIFCDNRCNKIVWLLPALSWEGVHDATFISVAQIAVMLH